MVPRIPRVVLENSRSAGVVVVALFIFSSYFALYGILRMRTLCVGSVSCPLSPVGDRLVGGVGVQRMLSAVSEHLEHHWTSPDVLDERPRHRHRKLTPQHELH